MKKLFLFAILIFSNFSFGQNVTVTDYEVPISTAQTLRLNAFWNWAQVGNSVTDNKANADLIFRKFYSSLPFAWFIDIDVAGGWDVNFPRERDSSKYNHNVFISSSARKYIWEDRNLFTFAKINIQHADTFKQIASNLTLGAGYGRYIDATALAKAVRIEEHLIREGAITGHLPKNT
ncbi:MAG: hypothetical protein N3A61_06470, partial [Ignavibacteria bacterium]|nr:hypothetical protein [Ignavibacteria bacterium]